jgi:hypothetical protein
MSREVWLMVVMPTAGLVLFCLCGMFSSWHSRVNEKFQIYEVTLKDGSKARAKALENYQITRAGALCFSDRSKLYFFTGDESRLSQCFAPGEWVKVEVLKP